MSTGVLSIFRYLQFLFFFLKVFIIRVFYLHGVSYQDIFYHLRLLQKVFFPIILSLFDICIQESYGLWGFFFLS